MNWIRLLIEGVIMGIIVLILGYVIEFITRPFFRAEAPAICYRLTSNYSNAFNLFLIGFIGHIGFELAGFNKWYCQHGHACMDM